MPSLADVATYRAGNARVRRLVLGEMQGFWATLDRSDPVRAARELETVVPMLIREYGDIAMTVAADFYDSQRELAKVPGRFSAIVGPGAPDEAAAASTRWAAGPLFGDAPDEPAALGRLAMVIDRLVLQDGRRVIHASMAADPAGGRVARVPSGAGTCAFCLMLASRGAVYQSMDTAGDQTKYHGHCDCVPTPVWRGSDLPAGYDPDALYDTFLKARDTAGSGNPKTILASLRAQEGTH